MKRWKYHSDSGAYEFYQTEDEKMLLQAAKTAEQLTVENNQLKDNMNKLLELLTQKNLMTKEEAEAFSTDSNDSKDKTEDKSKVANKTSPSKTIKTRSNRNR